MSDRERMAVALICAGMAPLSARDVLITAERAGLLIISRERLARVLRHVTARGKWHMARAAIANVQADLFAERLKAERMGKSDEIMRAAYANRWSRAWHKCAAKWRREASTRLLGLEMVKAECRRIEAALDSAERERDAARAELAAVRGQCQDCAHGERHSTPDGHMVLCKRLAVGSDSHEPDWHCADWRAKGG